MSADHFREHFEEAAAGTVAERARLEVEPFGVWSESKSLEVIPESVEVDS
jgi:hypothetical protein